MVKAPYLKVFHVELTQFCPAALNLDHDYLTNIKEDQHLMKGQLEEQSNSIQLLSKSSVVILVKSKYFALQKDESTGF